jgi:hypothetical protein
MDLLCQVGRFVQFGVFDVRQGETSTGLTEFTKTH